MTETQCISASRRLVPGWTKAQLNVTPLHGGLSNKLFLVQVHDLNSIDPDSPHLCIMRLFCMSSDLIDRAYEQRVFAFLSESGFGPQVYGTDGIWRAEQYLPGNPLHVSQLSQPNNLSEVADLLARFHSLSPPASVAEDKSRTILDLVDRWVQVAMQLCPDGDQLGRRLQTAKDEFDNGLRPLLCMMSCPIVFCHNDAQEGNVLFNPDGQYALIDYEYASWNYRGYDLANVVCECIIDNNCPNQVAGFQIRPDLQPTQHALEQMAAAYLSRINGCRPTPSQISELIKEVRLFQPVSHILWASWAAAKTWSSTAIQFGYREYADARLDLFDRDMSRT